MNKKRIRTLSLMALVMILFSAVPVFAADGEAESGFVGTFWALIPPVGMNFRTVKAAPMALIILSPPAFSAGKNLTLVSPALMAWIISLAVCVPGHTGMSFARQ